MSSPHSPHSRTNSVYLDAPEIPIESLDEDPSALVEASVLTTTSQLERTPEPNEDDHEDEDEEDDSDEDLSIGSGDEIEESTEAEYSQRGRSPVSPVTHNHNQEEEADEDQDEDEEFILQVDPTTGMQRATSITRNSGRSRSSSLTQRLRRQHRRMNSSTRSGGAARSGTSRFADSGSSVFTAASTTSTSARAAVVPVVDEKAQSELRRKIMDIQRDPTIRFAEKAAMIQKLMWRGSQKASEHQTTDRTDETTEDDLKTTYNNEEQGVLGCKHYKRGCKLKANCCGKWFNCRFCHDDVCNHAIVRNETKTMLCMHCKAIQPAAQSCSSCNAQLARYYCDICKLWDDDPIKSIYHCADCGICRLGNGLDQDFFHCKKCNICMNIQLKDNHKCIERNLECDCPICGEYMFTSTTTVIFMPCGHCIHAKCHEEYVKTSYQCPTCWKALGDMSVYYGKIDSLLAEQTMPPEYANIFSIVLCNDCEVKSEAPYHFLYHKCDKCKGYNTKVLETFKRVSEGQVQVVENATAAGAAGTVPENNISGGSSAVAGSSSSITAGPSSSGNNTTSTMTTTAIHLPTAPRSPLLDGNASGDMTFGGMSGSSGNSAP
ncbi:hypothetical protein BC939DRAFT_456387 [Gamsiella multidivaricata]|uniref:uncharacterized protein n=1 Tax=Gamsiella multidivaricata TaxID=101098 RepID=UPI00221F054C|nr:uncharacterized protein BC939DRAFT_456387 [Gamsiella multidivaricata]KAI7821055.1 hypothetical protein BC939DRAFT_456387 [Gamsiella multidivaricata]